MNGERANAVGRAAAIGAEREQRVRGLRLAVRDPAVVRAALEVRIFEVDLTAHVTARREGDDARAVRADESGPQTLGELEVADVVRRELALVATRGADERCGHDPGVVDQQV